VLSAPIFIIKNYLKLTRDSWKNESRNEGHNEGLVIGYKLGYDDAKAGKTRRTFKQY
jgi:hypothetical protein